MTAIAPFSTALRDRAARSRFGSGGQRLGACADVDDDLALGIDIRVIVDVAERHLQAVADELNLVAVDRLLPAHVARERDPFSVLEGALFGR